MPLPILLRWLINYKDIFRVPEERKVTFKFVTLLALTIPVSTNIFLGSSGAVLTDS